MQTTIVSEYENDEDLEFITKDLTSLKIDVEEIYDDLPSENDDLLFDIDI